MQRFRKLKTLFTALAVAALIGAPVSARAQMGYTGEDLMRIGQWLRYNGLELYRLEIPNYATPYAAALTSGKHGWRIVVFLRDGGVTNADWDSGFLSRPFQLASTDNFVLIPRVGNNFGVIFSGCNQGACRQNYGAVLYLPWSHELFQKTVGRSGVACSASLAEARYSDALAAIDGALVRQQAGVAGYRPPACPSEPTR